MVLGARTFISSDPSGRLSGYGLFPYVLYFLAALLGPKRGLLAALCFLGLGILGLPFFLNDSLVWSLSGYLNFFAGQGGRAYLGEPYYYVCIVILPLLGGIFFSLGRGNFIGTIGLVLLGHIMYLIYTIAISLAVYHMSLPLTLSYQVHLLTGMPIVGPCVVPCSLVRRHDAS